MEVTLRHPFVIQLDRENDGRWIADIEALPGVLCYGDSRAAAIQRVEALALRVIADKIEHGEAIGELEHLFTIHA